MLPNLTQLRHSTDNAYGLVVQIGGGLFSGAKEECPTPTKVTEIVVPNAKGLLLEDAIINALDQAPNIIDNVNKVLLDKAGGDKNSALQLLAIDFHPETRASNSIRVSLTMSNFQKFVQSLPTGKWLAAISILPSGMETLQLDCTIILSWTMEDQKAQGLTIDLTDLHIKVNDQTMDRTGRVGNALLSVLQYMGYLPVVIKKGIISGERNG